MLLDKKKLATKMATYWKSQPKKYCKFCNCWITDNKPSVDFHERGKNHQENVKRKINEVKKKSTEQAKEREELEDDMKKMEKAAMEAFKKDLKDNPELAAKYGVKIRTDAEKLADKEAKRKEREAKLKKEEEEREAVLKAEEELMTKLATCKWFEAKSPEGYSYYWNVETNETIWVAPEEFVSLAEVRAQEQKAKEEAEKQKAFEEQNLEEDESEAGVSVGPMPRVPQSAYEEEESASEFYGLPTEAPPLPIPSEAPPPPLPTEPEIIPLPPSEPLPIEHIPLPPPPEEIQIPPPEEVKLPPPQEEKKTQEKRSKFKEKTVTSLGKDTNVTFKKRKLASGARNVRRRDDD
ncbi:FBP21 [Mytilus edulis]|uniref:WBP4 n=1 Tax=Mytilus edulis TaxID=6550 RepID=A0A8S3V7J8_MYTED|nr:FBP21 [Mytilus edulis]